MPKTLKNKIEIVKNGILLKFWISNISIFFIKNHSFAEYVDKISDQKNKIPQKFYNIFENRKQVK